MRKLFAAFVALLLLSSAYKLVSSEPIVPIKKIEFAQGDFRVGDLIFQTSNSSQSKAIQLATDSKFSHVGMVVFHDGKQMVLEAVQPVKLTPVQEFISRGQNGAYTIKRLKPEFGKFGSEEQAKLQRAYSPLIGKNYDIYFNWSNDELYCSELVWKMYKQVFGIELSKPKPLKSYHLDHPLVKQQMTARYGNKIPWEELMVSPQDLFDSEYLQ